MLIYRDITVQRIKKFYSICIYYIAQDIYTYTYIYIVHEALTTESIIINLFLFINKCMQKEKKCRSHKRDIV